MIFFCFNILGVRSPMPPDNPWSINAIYSNTIIKPCFKPFCNFLNLFLYSKNLHAVCRI